MRGRKALPGLYRGGAWAPQMEALTMSRIRDIEQARAKAHAKLGVESYEPPPLVVVHRQVCPSCMERKVDAQWFQGTANQQGVVKTIMWRFASPHTP